MCHVMSCNVILSLPQASFLWIPMITSLYYHFLTIIVITASGFSAETSPSLQFSLYYDIEKNLLAIYLQQAYNLSVSQSIGADKKLIVVIFLFPDRREVLESAEVRKSENPVFDQVLHISELPEEEQIHNQTLVFCLYQYNWYACMHFPV